MTKYKRGGLGRGIGALIPTAPTGTAPSPSDIFFGDGPSLRITEAAEAAEPPAPGEPGDGTHETDRADGSDDTDGTNAGRRRSSVDERSASETRSCESTESDLVPVPGARLHEIAVGQIRANARQPRTVFDDDALAELTHSIREFGVLQPIVVRQVDDGFELVMGERRLRAATAAGLASIPAIVRDTTDDAMLRDALLENIHRAQLNPLEEAAAYQQLLEDFGVTHEELATRIGRSRSHLSNTIRLMNLSVPVQRRVAAGVLSAGHARALLGLADSDAQDQLATRIVAEGLSVRATEELVSLGVNTPEGGGPARRRPVRRFTAPAATELADRLSDAFDTRVRVDIGQRKGKIVVEFASIDDLERIVAVMAPHLSSRSADQAEEPNRE